MISLVGYKGYTWSFAVYSPNALYVIYSPYLEQTVSQAQDCMAVLNFSTD